MVEMTIIIVFTLLLHHDPFAYFSSPTGKEQCWVSVRWGSPSSWGDTLCWGPSYFLALKEVISSYHPHDHDHNHDDFMIGGVGRMPSSQAAHGRNSPTVMNSTTLLGTLPSEVIIIVAMIIVTIMMTVMMTMMTIHLGTLPQGKRMMRMRNMMIMNITMMIKMIIMIMNHGYRHHHQNHHHHDNR